MGFMFALTPIFYLFNGILTSYQPKWISKRVYLILGALIGTVGMLFIGPSRAFSFPDSWIMIAIGQCLFGISLSQLNIFSLPEMMEQANIAYPGQEQDVDDRCSGVFNSCLGIGQVVGPLLGSYLSVQIGFRFT